MDELTRRLKEDAQRIDATVSPELERRIQGALEHTRPTPPPTRRTEWWAALLGLASAAALGSVLVSVAPREP